MTQLSQNIQRPAWLTETDSGVDNLAQFIVPPRLKIVQPTSKLVDDFTMGDVLLMPQKMRVTGLQLDEKKRLGKNSDSILFTPLFFFAEYCVWNPLEDKSQMIIESTYDQTSEIAQRARDYKRRREPHPTLEGKYITYREHLNFIVLMHLEGFNVLPCLMSFAGAEHRSGTNFAAMIKMRMAPMYACQFTFKVASRENDRGRWYGLDIENPTEQLGGFVNEQMFSVTKKFYADLKAAHEARNIRVEHDVDDSDILEGQVVNPEL